MLSLMQRARTEAGVNGQMSSSCCFASFSSRMQCATFCASVNFMSLASADLALHRASSVNSGVRPESGCGMWAPTSASESTATFICAGPPLSGTKGKRSGFSPGSWQSAALTPEFDPLRTHINAPYTNFMIKPVAPAPPISLKVRRLETSDVANYRELRLESLRCHPEAFSSSWEYEADKPGSWWAECLETNTVFGGWGERFAARRRSGLASAE